MSLHRCTQNWRTIKITINVWKIKVGSNMMSWLTLKYSKPWCDKPSSNPPSVWSKPPLPTRPGWNVRAYCCWWGEARRRSGDEEGTTPGHGRAPICKSKGAIIYKLTRQLCKIRQIVLRYVHTYTMTFWMKLANVYSDYTPGFGEHFFSILTPLVASLIACLHPSFLWRVCSLEGK